MPVIVTVHGTNDADVSDEGRRWWQHGSQFTEKLKERLTERGVAAEILPFHWSGANSDYDRLRGAAELRRVLQRLARSGRRHAVIAHSHGGNVTQEALARASCSPVRGGIVSFGTPFFRRRLKTVPFLIALFQLVMGVIITPIMIGYLIWTLGSDSNKKIEAVVLFGGVALATGWALIAGARKIFHNRLAVLRSVRSISPSQWLVMYSPRDEAMRLLESAALLSPQFVKTAAAVRALTAFASLVGVAATAAIFVRFGAYFLQPIANKITTGDLGVGIVSDLTFLLLVPLVYGAIFFTIAGLARAGGGWLYARFLSSAIQNGILGAAFGGDGPHKLTGVLRRPTYLTEIREERIDALSFGGVDDAAVFVAAQKLYDAVVAAEGPEGGIADPDAMWKRLSDALYHNAYMRDDDVVATVADHLVAHWPG